MRILDHIFDATLCVRGEHNTPTAVILPHDDGTFVVFETRVGKLVDTFDDAIRYAENVEERIAADAIVELRDTYDENEPDGWEDEEFLVLYADKEIGKAQKFYYKGDGDGWIMKYKAVLELDPGGKREGVFEDVPKLKVWVKRCHENRKEAA